MAPAPQRINLAWMIVEDFVAGRTGSLLAERPHVLVAERFHQIRDDRPFAGLHEGLDRHAGQQFDFAEPRHLLRRQ